MELKTFSGTVDLKPTAGKFKALVCTFGIVDKGGDVVQRGAFAQSLATWRAANRRIPVIYNHRDDDPLMHVGFVNPHNSEETDVGLVVTGELYLNEERGRKVHAELQRGTLAEWSYACLIREARPRQGGGRDLLALDLIEVSPTLIGKGTTETLMVASATAVTAASPPAPPIDEQLAPYRARIDVARARVARSRA